MIKFETHVGKELGTLELVGGKLKMSSPAVMDIVAGKQAAFGLDDEQVYAYFRSGALDNGYVKATEVAA